MIVPPVVIAFLSAYSVATVSVLTEKFPDYIFDCARSRWLHGYGLVIACIGVAFYIGSTQLGIDVGLKTEWIKAMVIGMGTKALLSFDLFSLKFGVRKYPVGLKMILVLLEWYFLKKAGLDILNKQFNVVHNMAKDFEEKHFEEFKKFLIAHINKKHELHMLVLPKEEVNLRIKRCKDVHDLLDVMNGILGPESIKLIVGHFKKEKNIK